MNIKAVCAEINNILSPSYLVGGSVRDYLLGEQAKDFDFCTPLLPDEVEMAVKSVGKRVYSIGKRYGTIGFKIEGIFIEVTTFRQEKYRQGSRKPDVVFVEDLYEDLSRRDFTINAMAIHFESDNLKLIDHFNGQEDITNKVIRAVGDPAMRINEDPLRMLRAARFAAQLDFDIEKDLREAVKKNAHKILEISRERWVTEIDKILISKAPAKGLEVIASTGLLKYILPELWIQINYDQDSPYHSLDLWNHTKKTVEFADNDIEIRWAALLHDTGKPFARTRNDKGYSNYIMHEKISAELTIGIAHRLKWSKGRSENVTNLVRNHMTDESPLRFADNKAKE